MSDLFAQNSLELKWVKGVKVQQFPSLLVDLVEGLGPGWV
jgi:hypothetical protein